MATTALLGTLVRELFGQRQLDRTPEPDLVMAGPEEVKAYTSVGRIQGPMAAAYLFHAARISQVIQGCSHVFDLACGPATQLCRVAELNPQIQFTGVDLSDGMLGNARAFAQELGLKNVTFRTGDITELRDIGDKEADGVMSTVALHHLPTLNHLRKCFHQIGRILRPNGALYLADFGRLKSAKSARFFAYKDADVQPAIFCRDYENSLVAAFLFEEFQTLARDELPARAKIHRTFPVPFFTVIKTEDRPISDLLRQTLKQKRMELEPRFRGDLDDIRRFFGFGGLGNDPFR